MVAMNWPEILVVAAGVLSPWVGLIILVVVQSHQETRVQALEEKVNALIGELGWKKED